jgi:transcriptional regulator with XRE-family HTH domain
VVSLSERLDESGYGVHRTRLGRIEAGVTAPTLEDVFALAVVLDTSPADLVIPFQDIGDIPSVVVLGRAERPRELRAWVQGIAPLGGQDPDLFRLQRPLSELLEQFPALTPVTVQQMVAREIAARGKEWRS